MRKPWESHGEDETQGECMHLIVEIMAYIGNHKKKSHDA